MVKMALLGTFAPAQTPHFHAVVVPPRLLTMVQPAYPRDAKKHHISGAVVLKASILKDGTVHNITVISGPPELTQAAVDAASQWRYSPATLNGMPNEAQTTITVNFDLNKD